MKTLISFIVLGIIFETNYSDRVSFNQGTEYASSTHIHNLNINNSKFTPMPDQYVTFYRDENYQGPSDSYPVGQYMDCLPNHTFWYDNFGIYHVFNDEITSLRVPPGVKVT
jgi:hypothetical protein